MNYLKLIGKNIGIMLVIILSSTLLVTLLNYFNIISGSLLSIFKIIIIFISFFTGGFLTGKKCTAKGWLEGLKLGVIFSIILFLINLIFIKNIALKFLLYYLILVVCSILGSMIGISKKTNQ